MHENTHRDNRSHIFDLYASQMLLIMLKKQHKYCCTVDLDERRLLCYGLTSPLGAVVRLLLCKLVISAVRPYTHRLVRLKHNTKLPSG